MPDFCDSRILIDALCNPAFYPHKAVKVQVLETHISWVLLAGRFAYKIKKPVNLGFLDFTELRQRQFFCREELRINRRLAPRLYLDVIPIGGSPRHPKFSSEPAFEYAVKMRRFASGNLLEKHALSATYIDKLAALLADFHLKLPPAAAGTGYGSPAVIAAPMRENFRQIATLLDANEPAAARLPALLALSEKSFLDNTRLFENRRAAGFIREGHGDLHLGNIVLLGDTPTPFDGLEFDANLRWIDVINDIAFLLMDLRHHGREDLAYRFLNAYLEATGDYGGLAVEPYYSGYRAMVRAKIAAIRFRQTPANSILKKDLNDYLTLAEACLEKPRPALIITHGLPGCGKTTLTQTLLETRKLIRLRSDVERKRLFGLSARQASGSGLNSGIYDAQAGERTYQRLLELARELLRHGQPLVVDAAFLKHKQRQAFYHLSRELEIPILIVAIHSQTELLRQRIRQRLQAGQDASEADLQVLELAIAGMEPLQADEQEHALIIENNDGFSGLDGDPNIQRRLDAFFRTG